MTFLPCPFCGNPEPKPQGEDDNHIIHCPRCGSTGPRAKTPGDAQLLWNERPYRQAIEASRQAAFDDTAKQLFGVKL